MASEIGPSRLSSTIDAVLVGRARPYTRAGSYSAIAKQAVRGEVLISEQGLDGDEQGDRRVHGGIDKALHHYAFDHYRAWRRDLGDLPLLGQPGAFGENLSTLGITEADICLGDRLRLGSAEVEVSQARQPCWKLNDRFGVPDMARRVQATTRTGWYYRVLQPGVVQSGDRIDLIARPYPRWPLARLTELLYRRMLDKDTLQQALELPLVPSWRRIFERRLANGGVEDWTARLGGPPQAPIDASSTP